MTMSQPNDNENPGFLHPSALVETEQIGALTRVAAFAHLFPGVTIGTACQIGERTEIGPDVQLGSHVTIQSGAQLGPGVRVEDLEIGRADLEDVFIEIMEGAGR